MNQSPSSKATQDFVPIQEIRDGIVILKDGSMRAILIASSLNFSLKSSDEQASIIYQFQNFLNSLEFSAQIMVQSKKLDIRPYIALLESRYKEQVSDLMKVQTREYIEFIKTFVDNSSIMTKSFFVIVPYTPAILTAKNNPISNLFNRDKQASNRSDGGTSGNGSKTMTNEEFEEHRSQLEQRVGVVAQELRRCDIRVIQLGTEEVVELFYKIFNPGETEKPIKVN